MKLTDFKPKSQLVTKTTLVNKPKFPVIGARAVSIEQGLTNDYLSETQTDRAILKVGRDVILVADHSKINRVSTTLLAPLTDIHKLVTDKQTPRAFISALKAQGIDTIVV